LVTLLLAMGCGPASSSSDAATGSDAADTPDAADPAADAAAICYEAALSTAIGAA